MVKVAIITYSTYGHITALAREVKAGVEAAGGEAVLFRVPETLSEDVLKDMYAAEKPDDFLVASKETLEEYDAFLFGVPTRFGNVPAQWADFWDKTGAIWVQGGLWGKPAGIFVSTGTYGGGVEQTVRTCINYLVHHGMVFVPLGYKFSFAELANIEEVHGGSAWGASTLAGGDGSRQPSALELRMAKTQGNTFYQMATKICSGDEVTLIKDTKSTKSETKKAAKATPTKKEPSTKTKTSAAPTPATAPTPAKKSTTAKPKATKENKNNSSFNPSKNCIIM
ncbi:Flavoprotein-like protein YCP4 [Nakaseomyces bracarensis]|uniref:Flavoprotein-like protein YCP4 n=1 Tax=Nakaseomyces bracarensis TaxID=273131 RepID=A0ABR4NNM6_9SACH